MFEKKDILWECPWWVCWCWSRELLVELHINVLHHEMYHHTYELGQGH